MMIMMMTMMMMMMMMMMIMMMMMMMLMMMMKLTHHPVTVCIHLLKVRIGVQLFSLGHKHNCDYDNNFRSGIHINQHNF